MSINIYNSSKGGWINISPKAYKNGQWVGTTGFMNINSQWKEVYSDDKAGLYDANGSLLLKLTNDMVEYSYSSGNLPKKYNIDESLVEHVILPNANSIGCNAFVSCSNLKTIDIPNSVTSIEESAFRNCESLTSITLPNNLKKIGDLSFYYAGLKSITIPGSVTDIGIYAFFNCVSLTSVTISNGVTTIGRNMFDTCYSLTSVSISSTVTNIKDGAFSSCWYANITIPDTVTSIGNDAFAGMKHITYHGTATGSPWGAKSIN